jgi:hypothetical protein
MNMFQPTGATTAEEYFGALDEPRRGEIRQLDELIRRTAPELGAPYLESGMLAYGRYHYKYASGREGDWFLVGLASRKAYISLYVNAADGEQYLAETYRERLPATDIGRSCVRFKKLANVDLDTVADLVRAAAHWGARQA